MRKSKRPRIPRPTTRDFKERRSRMSCDASEKALLLMMGLRCPCVICSKGDAPRRRPLECPAGVQFAMDDCQRPALDLVRDMLEEMEHLERVRDQLLRTLYAYNKHEAGILERRYRTMLGPPLPEEENSSSNGATVIVFPSPTT